MIDSTGGSKDAAKRIAARMNAEQGTDVYYAGYGMGQWHVYADTLPEG